MVAIVYIPVMLHHKAITAGLAHRADSRLYLAILGQSGVEHLHEILPDITDDPLIKNILEELPVTLRADAPGSQSGALGLRRDNNRSPEIRPVHDMFHSRKELHIMAPDGFEE